MTRDNLIKLMVEKPYLLEMGKGKLSKRFKCTQYDIVEARQIAKKLLYEKKDKPKVLLFDTERSPLAAYVWSRWNNNVALNQTINEWFMICWSAKWLGEDEIMCDCLTSEEAIKQDDNRIMRNLWKLFNEADIIIAHNIKKADVPWCNSRFIVNGLQPPTPYQMVDTLDVAKKKFGFSSNKLDALAGYFGLEGKLETSFELWKGCMFGDERSLMEMLEYNINDVKVLEEVYIKMLPWINGHPNVANLIDADDIRCCNCGSDDYETLFGEYYYTSSGRYQLYRCKKCGSIFRDRKQTKHKNDIKVVPCAR